MSAPAVLYSRALRRRRPSPPLRTAVRALAGATVAAAIAVPLMRRRLRVPRAATTAVVAAAPLAIAVLRPRTRARDVVSSPSRCGRSRSCTSFPTTIRTRCGGDCASAIRSSADRVLGAGRLPNQRLQRALSRPEPGHGARPGALARALGLVLRTAPDAALRPGTPRGPLPARGAPDGGHLRPRLRALLGRARPRRRGGPPSRATFEQPLEQIRPDEVAADAVARAPDEVRRIMIDVGEAVWGSSLGPALRVARRQPVGGDAVASLRHLADGGAAPGGDFLVPGALGAGVRGRARLRARLPRRAVVTDLLAGAALRRPGQARRADRRAGGPPRSTGSCSRLERVANPH